MQESASSLDIVLDQLTFGRVHLHQGDFQKAIYRLDLVVAGFRAAGQNQYLPLGLLARAALYSDTRNPNRDFTRAHQDLQEVYDIAEPISMRLHLTDYHLEMARLLIAERGNPLQSPFFKGGSQRSDVVAIPPLEKGGPGGISVQEHVAKAAKLIEEKPATSDACQNCKNYRKESVSSHSVSVRSSQSRLTLYLDRVSLN